ncbi:MAG: 2-amino-4-hydroxy-6-hydroxymethyldihydropteridine diphosphokinase [Candidatus Scalindua sp. AMX11]|nr:MAG: 2-amino-4-hydroxy-6-hydroxymethyldihydropteridine diphosphokinase [Candidatus Scalindua sp.]NOG85718.1 2-amino-4-hydroxy-6-hydroxymethyldihydropteridine diphosphokinase [Planctomycetota bacterium]RZV73166.1 MAG: 2-amino-4-hydroxy-6-hydroxymethyldihydropteridine diphosphokinase [Candidatus Scalindua sp. SCAELEC01]TDE64745.1 MAG: 2-amino-4-hydroxy-6-hydroxymethyldihydropteridine diphosphokinase [Candidatus Scalindua sp. AMX11]GJQ58693.1 MAG: 2-amino-4-hydroxy-6-hydroxymethyldihydropteridi
MINVYLGIGSNLGNRKKNLDDAVARIAAFDGVCLITRSGYYETDPVGGPQQPDYLNCVVAVQTEIEPVQLLRMLKRIEKELGRRPGVRWGPRVIDIDILLYDDMVINHEDLKIPHERMHERMFVLEPLNEISPDLIHPVLKKSIFELLCHCKQSKIS